MASFFGSIKSAVTNVASSLKNAGKSALAAVASPILASAGKNQLPQKNQSIAPSPSANMSTVLGPAMGGVGTNTIKQLTPQGFVDITKDLESVSRQSTTPSLYFSQKSGSTVRQATPSSASRVSSTAAAAPSSPRSSKSKGQDVIMGETAQGGTNFGLSPQFADNGFGGFGRSSFSSFSTPAVAQGGRSAFTGLLTAAGGLLAPSTAEAGTLEDTTKPNRGIGSRLLTTAKNLFTPQSIAALSNPLNAATTFGSRLGGSVLNSLFARSTQSKIESPLDVSSVGPVQNAGSIVTSQQKSAPITALPAAQKYSDRDQTIQSIYQQAMDIKAQIDQMEPTPPEPVVDTPEQLMFIQQSDDPFGIQQAIDDFKRGQTDLFDLQRDAIEAQKELTALNEAYQKIADDINSDPDFPKGLALRRFEELRKNQAVDTRGLVGRLELLERQMELQNENVNRQFGIVTNLQDREEKRQDRQLKQIEFLINTGAIGGMTDAELSQIASATGISLKGLKASRDKVLRGEQGEGFTLSPGQTRYDAQGNPIASVPDREKGGGTGGGIYGNLKLSTGQKSDLADIDTLLSQIGSLQAIDTKDLGGAVGGFMKGTFENLLYAQFGKGSSEEATIRANISNIRANIAKLRGGTSFTANEEKLLNQYVPTINESAASVLSKLVGLQTFLQTKKDNIITVAGGTSEFDEGPDSYQLGDGTVVYRQPDGTYQ